MLRGLRGSVRGVRFRSNRREIAFFAPTRACRRCAVMDRGSSGAARWGDHLAAKFVKFVHFHSAISSSLPQGVSGRGRWLVHLPHSSPRLACRKVNPLCLGAGSAPILKKDSAVRARGGHLGQSSPWRMRPPYGASGPAPRDTPPLVAAERSSALRLEGTARDAVKLRNHHRHCGQRARPITPLNGIVRRVEN